MEVVRLFQLCAFGFGLLKDGNIGVGVSPQREEILIRSADFGANGVVASGRSTLLLTVLTAPLFPHPA